jgi:hypothetical protein
MWYRACRRLRDIISSQAPAREKESSSGACAAIAAQLLIIVMINNL